MNKRLWLRKEEGLNDSGAGLRSALILLLAWWFCSIFVPDGSSSSRLLLLFLPLPRDVSVDRLVWCGCSCRWRMGTIRVGIGCFCRSGSHCIVDSSRSLCWARIFCFRTMVRRLRWGTWGIVRCWTILGLFWSLWSWMISQLDLASHSEPCRRVFSTRQPSFSLFHFRLDIVRSRHRRFRIDCSSSPWWFILPVLNVFHCSVVVNSSTEIKEVSSSEVFQSRNRELCILFILRSALIFP